MLLCRSEAERERAAVLFPKLVAIYANGEMPWEALARRNVVAFGVVLAMQAGGYAASVKLIDDEIPTDLTQAEALAWAKARATPYNANPVPQDPAGVAPPAPQAGIAGAHSPVKVEAVGHHSPATPAPALLDHDLSAAEPPPDLTPTFPPEATVERPKPKKRHLRSVFQGNTALAPDQDAEPMPAAMSEDHIADHFAAAQKDDLRFIAARNMWLVWNGSHWKPDAKKEVDRRVVEHCREAVNWPDAASLTPDGKRKVGSKRFAGAVRDFTQSDRRIAAEYDQFGRDPYLLGVPGGVVDLKTGKVIEAEREHYITRQTAVSPAVGVPSAWLAFLTHICKGDESLLAYMQRWCGYFLCGDSSEEAMLFAYGPASRGKSKFVGALREMMGTYAVSAGMDTFTESRMERHSEELAALAGARLIVASETEAGRRWNEARIKALTGRDTIRARMLHENSIEFQLGKIVIAGNHAPALRNVDDTFRRRLHILEFSNPVDPEKLDLHLDDKLRTEYPQILQWCIEGCLAWQECGLGKPEQIMDAVNQYLESEDTLAEWLESNTQTDAVARTASGDLYADYRRWAEGAGEFVLSQKRFVQQLSERGFSRARAAGKRYLCGLRLVAAPAARDDPYK